MFSQDTDETFHRAEACTVNHDSTMFLTIFTDVFYVEAFRQVHIQLDSTTLPCTTQGVFDMVVKFRTIERTVARVDYIIDTFCFDSVAQCFCSCFPNCIIAHCIIRFSGQFNMVFQTELAIDAVEQFDNFHQFRLHLFRQHEYVCIVLCESTNAEQAV